MGGGGLEGSRRGKSRQGSGRLEKEIRVKGSRRECWLEEEGEGEV